MEKIKVAAYRLLKWSERYTKTDMIYAAKSGFWLNINFIIGSLLSFGLTVLFAYFIPKEIFGMYKYVISIAGIAVAFSLNGMNTAVIRAVAQGYEGVLKRSIIVQLKWILPQFLFSFAFSLYYFYQSNPVYGISFLIVSVLSPISSVANTYNAFLQGKKDFRTTAYYGILSNVFYATITAAAVLFTPSAVFLIAAYYLASFLTNIYFCLKTIKKFKPGEAFRNDDISYGKHLSVLNILGMLAYQLDSVIVYHLLGPVELAIYSFAIAMPERIRVFFGFVATAALPKLSEKEDGMSRSSISNKTWQLVIIGLGIAVVYFFLAPFIFQWFFPQYSESIAYSRIFAFSLVVIASNVPMSALYAGKFKKHLYIFGTVAPVVRIAVTVLSIYFFGLWGAIASKILTYVFNALFSSALYRDTTLSSAILKKES